LKNSFAIFIAISILLFSSVIILENYKTSSLGIKNIQNKHLKYQKRLLLVNGIKIIENEIKNNIQLNRCIDNIFVYFDDYIIACNILYIDSLTGCSNTIINYTDKNSTIFFYGRL